MSEMDEVEARLGKLPSWKLCAAAAGCAERVSPVFTLLRSASGTRLFGEGVELLWQVAQGVAARVELTQLASAIQDLLDPEEDDSHRPAYYSMLALTVLASATECARTADARAGQSACMMSADIANALDTLLTAEPGETWMLAPGEVPSLGPLEAAEVRAQMEVISIVERAPEASREVVEALRATLPGIVSRWGQAVQDVTRRQGWMT